MSYPSTDATAINAYVVGDPEGRILLALRVGDKWHDYQVSRSDAETLRDILHLLTRTENVEESS